MNIIDGESIHIGNPEKITFKNSTGIGLNFIVSTNGKELVIEVAKQNYDIISNISRLKYSETSDDKTGQQIEFNKKIDEVIKCLEQDNEPAENENSDGPHRHCAQCNAATTAQGAAMVGKTIE